MNIIADSVHIDPTSVIGGPAFSFSKGSKRKLQESKFNVIIGEGVYIAEFCNVHRGTFRNTTIGENTIIDSHVHISHDCIIGKNCEIDTGSTILGEVTIGDNTRICSKATVHPKVVIGKNCVVGANSYLRHDLKDGELCYGVPAVVVKNSKYKNRN